MLSNCSSIGTIARKTTLSGSVSRGRGGTGRTFLPPIAGAAGVRVRLKSPPFVFRATSLVADAEVSKSSSGSAHPAALMSGRAIARCAGIIEVSQDDGGALRSQLGPSFQTQAQNLHWTIASAFARAV